MSNLIQDLLKLVTGTLLGSFSTFLNIIANPQTTLPDGIYPILFSLMTTIFGIASAIFTCIYMYWQIKKIRYEFKLKKNAKPD